MPTAITPFLFHNIVTLTNANFGTFTAAAFEANTRRFTVPQLEVWVSHKPSLEHR